MSKKKKDPRNKLNQRDEDPYAKNYKRLIKLKMIQKTESYPTPLDW